MTIDRPAASWLFRHPNLWRTIYWTATGLGALYVSLALAGFAGIGGCVGGTIVSCDAAAYWYATPSLYEPQTVPGVPPYLYSPAFAWVTAPFRWIPFDVFVWVWAALHVAALLWLRAGWMLAVPGMNEDVIRGNINTFVALAIVLGLRHGGPWALVLLTKVAPAVGLVWHLVRREWGHLAWAVGMTIVVVVLGLALAPDLWLRWVEVLRASPTDYAGAAQGIPWVVRSAIAALVVGYAAYSSRAWIVPIAVLAAWPGFLPPAGIVLAAVPRLWRWPRPPLQEAD